MTALCATRPAEWWSSDDDGARLALALCRACPDQSACVTADPAPHGVIRGGLAYSDTGDLVPPCPTCGYPQLGFHILRPDACRRCRVPSLSRWRHDIIRWHAAGITAGQAGRRLGATSVEIRDFRRSRVGRATSGEAA